MTTRNTIKRMAIEIACHEEAQSEFLRFFKAFQRIKRVPSKWFQIKGTGTPWTGYVIRCEPTRSLRKHFAALQALCLDRNGIKRTPFSKDGFHMEENRKRPLKLKQAHKISKPKVA